MSRLRPIALACVLAALSSAGAAHATASDSPTTTTTTNGPPVSTVTLLPPPATTTKLPAARPDPAPASRPAHTTTGPARVTPVRRVNTASLPPAQHAVTVPAHTAAKAQRLAAEKLAKRLAAKRLSKRLEAKRLAAKKLAAKKHPVHHPAPKPVQSAPPVVTTPTANHGSSIYLIVGVVALVVLLAALALAAGVRARRQRIPEAPIALAPSVEGASLPAPPVAETPHAPITLAPPVAITAPAIPQTPPTPAEVIAPLAVEAAPHAAFTLTPIAEHCEIDWWRGYVRSCFVARTNGSGPNGLIAESPPFRWRASSPPPERHDLVAAYRTLEQQLESLGWEADGCGDDWYQGRFRRRRPTSIA